MKPEVWKRAKEILPEARELPLEERAAFLDKTCGNNTELRREIESFLATDPEALAFIERPPIRLLGEGDSLQEDSQLGAYRILRRLGSGGMGIVYLATRVGDEFKREVAIKVLPPEQTSEEAEQRFLQEMGILAALNHPNIAKLYEGGRTDDGRLYYLMEYVEGQPIDVYCREKKLSLEKRLDLFQKVAAAVQYAHAHPVVHRDIKPSNVLVTADGEPKLLDFGVGKPLEGAGLGAPVVTGRGQRLFTPDYASPEQLAGSSITTASDIYSLGVLLYELLAGHRPFRQRGEGEVPRQDRGEKLVPPSTAVSHQAEATTTGGPPAKDPTTASFRRKLEGDLDTIVLKALREEPEQRYASVEQLAEDLRRYSDGHPIRARRPTLRYRAGKYLRRNALWVGLAAVFLAVIAIAAFALLRQHQETARERDRAEAIAGFLNEIFAHSDPLNRNSPETTARELLDRAVEDIEGQLGQAPEAKASLLVSLGTAYMNLGLYDQATDLLETAVELTQEHAPGSEVLGDALQGLAVVKMHAGDLQSAEQYQQQALSLRRRLLGGKSEKVATSLNTLGLLCRRLGRYEEAEAAYREALEIRRLDEEDRLPLARSLQNLAVLMRSLNRYEEAEDLLAEAIDIKTQVLGADHPSTAISLHNLGRLYKTQGRFEEAKEQYQKALRIRRHSLGDLHPSTASTLDNLGVLHLELGEYEEAGQVLEESLRSRQQMLPPDHPDIANSYHNLAAQRFHSGDFLEAGRLFRKALAIREEALGADHDLTLRTRASVAAALEMQGRLQEAESLLLRCIQLLQEQESVDHREVARLKRNMAILLAKTDRHEEAERFAREATAEFRAILAEDHPDVAEADSILGGVLLLQGRLAEAEPLLRSSYEVLLAARGPEASATEEARKRLEALERLLTESGVIGETSR